MAFPIDVTPTTTFKVWRETLNTVKGSVPERIEANSADPANTDWDYPIGSLWIHLNADTAFILVHSTGSGTAVWIPLGAVQSVVGGTGLTSTGGVNPSLSHDAHTGDVTGATALTIAADAVTYAKMQNIAADDVLLGNISGVTQPAAEITVAQIKTMLSLGSISEKTYWSGTQAAYDGLGSWDSNTIYFITT